MSVSVSQQVQPEAPPDAAGRGVGHAPRLEGLEVPVLALLIALLCFEVIALAYGQAPASVLSSLWAGTWGTAYGTGQVLFKATPLMFTGLSVGLAFRAGLFNIGGEGQAVLGALATGVTGAWLPASTPGLFAIPLCCLAGIAAGALWGAVPGLLRARFGAHEVITTIMLNFIAIAVSSWLMVRWLALPETLHTAPVVEGARLWRLEQAFPAFHGSPANAALGLALLAAVAVGVLLFRTRLGYELRAMGLSPGAAEFGGVAIGRTTVAVMALAGALAGLVGTNYVLGYKYYHEEGFSSGVGFLGIAVALLGRSHPAGIVAAALLFGTLSQGGLAINALIPKETMDILQAVIILTVAAASGRSLERGGRR
jgi:simple sugar transport system permease protein